MITDENTEESLSQFVSSVSVMSADALALV